MSETQPLLKPIVVKLKKKPILEILTIVSWLLAITLAFFSYICNVIEEQPGISGYLRSKLILVNHIAAIGSGTETNFAYSN
jgi:hypothetical protein